MFVKRNKAQRFEARDQIARLRLQGVTLRQISLKVGISLATVKRELVKMEEQWRADAAGAIETAKARELAKLEQIERVAWAEWERSCEDYVKEKAERITFTMKEATADLQRAIDSAPASIAPDAGNTFETAPKLVTRETGGRIGDPKLLQIALAAHERRCKLLGLDAPSKVAPTDPTGQKPYVGSMPDAELAKRIAELQGKLRPSA